MQPRVNHLTIIAKLFPCLKHLKCVELTVYSGNKFVEPITEKKKKRKNGMISDIMYKENIFPKS